MTLLSFPFLTPHLGPTAEAVPWGQERLIRSSAQATAGVVGRPAPMGMGLKTTRRSPETSEVFALVHHPLPPTEGLISGPAVSTRHRPVGRPMPDVTHLTDRSLDRHACEQGE